jgi:hypothetical protein
VCSGQGRRCQLAPAEHCSSAPGRRGGGAPQRGGGGWPGLVSSGISGWFCFRLGQISKKRTTKQYDGNCVQYVIQWEGKTGNKSQTKTYFGELKTYLRATDHTSSNIISRD